jgi:hypothetical protein
MSHRPFPYGLISDIRLRVAGDRRVRAGSLRVMYGSDADDPDSDRQGVTPHRYAPVGRRQGDKAKLIGGTLQQINK